MKIVLLMLAVTVLASCSSKKRIYPVGDKNGKFVSIYPSWIKEKGEKFDTRINLKNESDDFVIVLLSDLICQKGKDKGRVRHTFFNTGERTIDLKPRELKSFNTICLLGFDNKSEEYSLKIRKVYANPAKDGASLGNVLEENVVWK